MPDSIAAALGITKPELLTRAVVEVDEQVQVMQIRPDTELLRIILMKGKDAVFASKQFRFLDSGHTDVNVSLPRLSISMTLL